MRKIETQTLVLHAGLIVCTYLEGLLLESRLTLGGGGLQLGFCIKNWYKYEMFIELFWSFQANNSSQSDYHVVQPIDPLAPVTKPNQTFRYEPCPKSDSRHRAAGPTDGYNVP